MAFFLDFVKNTLAQWDSYRNAWAWFNNFKRLGENVNTLRNKTEDLVAREKDVEAEVIREEVQLGKKRKREVAKWQDNVKRIKEEVQSVEERYKDDRGWMSRYGLAMLVREKTTYVEKLQEISRFPDGMVVDPLAGCGSSKAVLPLAGRRNSRIENEIWDYLQGSETAKIGVYGMGGVGKTTIVKHMNNRLKDSGLFPNIIWVTVARDLSLKRLQNDIAEVIGLFFSKPEDEDSRTTELFEALIRRKKFVLILDDIWEAFPFEAIGIPQPNEDNYCKVILTSRVLQVCIEMGTQIEIKVDVLPEDEAWALFKNKLDIDMLPKEVESPAKLVAEKCGGLPLAIIVVARALRKQLDVSEWRKVLRELSPSTSSEIKGMKDDVFWRLRFSFNRLSNDQVRACFLYCSLYPEDYIIHMDELIDNWVCERLIDDSGNREDVYGKGKHILNQLINACMLENVLIQSPFDVVEGVKMHDLIRDLALDLTTEKPCFMVKAGFRLDTFPIQEELVDVYRLSLMRNDIKILLDQPNCPRLSTLFLGGNSSLHYIATSFFEHMKGLKVLDLSESTIDTLPVSLFYLENLSKLKLWRCGQLKSIPSVAN